MSSVGYRLAKSAGMPYLRMKSTPGAPSMNTGGLPPSSVATVWLAMFTLRIGVSESSLKGSPHSFALECLLCTFYEFYSELHQGIVFDAHLKVVKKTFVAFSLSHVPAARAGAVRQHLALSASLRSSVVVKITYLFFIPVYLSGVWIQFCRVAPRPYRP